MKILVLSCNKNADLFDLFNICFEKNWINHPEVIYSTESVVNPHYRTICKNYDINDINKWTKRIRETLKDIDDDKILIMVDDIFIKKPVDVDRINYLLTDVDWKNIACFNFEKQFDKKDIDVGIKGFKQRNHGSRWELSIMCGLWDKNKLINILENDSDPWSVEIKKDTKGYDFCINSGDYIIDWGYVYGGQAGIWRGKWTKTEVEWLKNNGFDYIDFDKRGYYK